MTQAEHNAGAFIGRMVQKYAHRLNNRQTIRDLMSRKEIAEMHELAREGAIRR